MAFVAHDRSPPDGMRKKGLPSGGKKAVLLTHRLVVYDIGKIDDEFRPDGADLSASINTQGR